MRITTAILPSLLLVLAAANCNGDDMQPENLPGEFGEPCTPGANDDTPDGCVSGLECWYGYCEQTCTKDADCMPIAGWDHSCLAGVCVIPCDGSNPCPVDVLPSPLTCGNHEVCESKNPP